MSVPPTPASPTANGNESAGIARWLATACGLGLLPFAPGTWGSLAGLALAWIFLRVLPLGALPGLVALSAAGVWAAGAVELSSGKKDPQEVVVDEVSGQWLALLASPSFFSGAPSWKSYLAGFILFRAFDIFKPFPARQAESLPGGWGIMADDWVAGAYAAAVLWLARAFGF
jgi:phosphatidylglycerophosphatase A